MSAIFLESKIQNVTLHFVGNKVADDGIILSDTFVNIDDRLKDLLLSYYISPFTTNEYFEFFHESELELNAVYTYVSRIFDNPDALYDQSVNLAKHLYEQSTHPKFLA